MSEQQVVGQGQVKIAKLNEYLAGVCNASSPPCRPPVHQDIFTELNF